MPRSCDVAPLQICSLERRTKTICVNARIAEGFRDQHVSVYMRYRKTATAVSLLDVIFQWLQKGTWKGQGVPLAAWARAGARKEREREGVVGRETWADGGRRTAGSSGSVLPVIVIVIVIVLFCVDSALRRRHAHRRQQRPHRPTGKAVDCSPAGRESSACVEFACRALWPPR